MDNLLTTPEARNSPTPYNQTASPKNLTAVTGKSLITNLVGTPWKMNGQFVLWKGSILKGHFTLQPAIFRRYVIVFRGVPILTPVPAPPFLQISFWAAGRNSILHSRGPWVWERSGDAAFSWPDGALLWVRPWKNHRDALKIWAKTRQMSGSD